MPRDTHNEAQLRLATTGGLPQLHLVGRLGNTRAWNVYRCGRGECRKGFAVQAKDEESTLMCPHCGRCGKTTKEE